MPKRTRLACSVEDCERPAERREWCGMHYQRVMKNGSPGVAATHRLKGRVCSVQGCERKSDSYGMCSMHRQRALKNGECGPVGTLRYMGPCIVEDCGRQAIALKLCGGHYNQQASGRDFTPIRRSWLGKALERDKDGNKQCRSCQGWFPEADYTRASKSKDGLTSYCPACRKDRALQMAYAISLAEYEARLAAQGGGCAICGSDERAHGREYHVDHDHACCPGRKGCGKCVRGLLCGPCNTGIGMLGEDANRMWSAMMYLAGGTP